MKRVLLDVNTLLDVILRREPFLADALALWTAAEQKRLRAVIPAHGVTTVSYIVRRAQGVAFANGATGKLLTVFGVALVDEKVLAQAQSLSWPDLEDAVCACAAERARCEAIVTRDPGGFVGSSLKVLTPAEAIVEYL